MQPLSRVLQQISGRAQTCVLAQVGCDPSHSPPGDISVSSVPSCAVVDPVSAPTPRLSGADPQSRSWVCMEMAPSPHRPLPQELPGRFPLLQSVPVPLPSLQPCQLRCSASRAISGSTLRRVPSAVGTMLKEMDSGGVHPPPVPSPGGCRRPRQSGQGCGGALCLQGKRCSSSHSRGTSSARLLRGCDVAVGPRNPGLRGKTPGSVLFFP